MLNKEEILNLSYFSSIEEFYKETGHDEDSLMEIGLVACVNYYPVSEFEEYFAEEQDLPYSDVAGAVYESESVLDLGNVEVIDLDQLMDFIKSKKTEEEKADKDFQMQSVVSLAFKKLRDEIEAIYKFDDDFNVIFDEAITSNSRYITIQAEGFKDLKIKVSDHDKSSGYFNDQRLDGDSKFFSVSAMLDNKYEFDIDISRQAGSQCHFGGYSEEDGLEDIIDFIISDIARKTDSDLSCHSEKIYNAVIEVINQNI